MALSNLYDWNTEENKQNTSCGASDKPDEKTAACGTACGASDKPEEKSTSCGTACGASDQ